MTPLSPPQIPDVVSAAWIAESFPGVSVVAIAAHELQVTREGHPIVVRLKLPHASVAAEGFATWPGVTQRFVGRGGGQAHETSKWEEPLEWPVGWSEWVGGWLAALSAALPRPVRPGIKDKTP